MTDNQQQPYGSDSVPQPAQPAQPAQPSYGQDAAQQPQGYGAPTARRIRSTRRRKLRPAATAIRPARRRIRSASVRPAAVRPAAVRPARTARSGLRPAARLWTGLPAAERLRAAAIHRRSVCRRPGGAIVQVKLAAGLLGIFLGGLGVHNFYLGNTGKAVAQLLLTLVGWILLGLGPIAAAIWGFVEGIIILCSKPGSPWHKDANGYELSD